MSMISGPEDASSSQMAGSSHSWVDQFNTGQSSGEHSQAPSTADSDSHRNGDSPRSNKGAELSDSTITSTDSSALSYEDSTKVRNPHIHSVCLVQGHRHQSTSYMDLTILSQVIPAVIPTIKTKAELWREVKILSAYTA